jgi:uncharacterized protein (DUF1778 family)
MLCTWYIEILPTTVFAMSKLHPAIVSAAAAAHQEDVSVTTRSEVDFSQFREHIDNPPPPNAALRLALARAVERKGSTKTD